jgi:hypothetical protein
VAVVEVDEAEAAEVELEGAVLLVARVEQHRGPDAGAQLDRLAVAERDDLGEPEPPEHLVQVTRPERGAQHRQVAGQAAEQVAVEVVGVGVGHVERVVPAGQHSVPEVVVVGEREPRLEERRAEPRVDQHPRAAVVDHEPRVPEVVDASHHRVRHVPSASVRPGARRGGSPRQPRPLVSATRQSARSARPRPERAQPVA